MHHQRIASSMPVETVGFRPRRFGDDVVQYRAFRRLFKGFNPPQAIVLPAFWMASTAPG
jgi:hypothetical protein